MNSKQPLQAVLILFTVLVFSSCKKSNVGEYPDFVGNWSGRDSPTNYEIVINSNGKATYEKDGINTDVHVNGKFRVKGSQMKIGLKKYDINAFPEFSSTDNLWRMTVDGIEYRRN